MIEAEDLHVRFGPLAPWVVKGVSLRVRRGECLALAGESGSGKSVTARALAGLAGHRAEVRAGRLSLDGTDLTRFKEKDWRGVRGSQIGFIMQDALGSLDPLRPVGQEIAEPLKLHTPLTRSGREAKVLDLLRSAGMPEPALRVRQYPHQLSGGLRQRALIASAISCGPRLLIADEPTTALDASVQAQVMELLERLRTEENGLLVISHDLAVVKRLADRVAIMRHGEIVEQGPAEAVLEDPQHEYTKSLLSAAASVRGAGRRFVPAKPEPGDDASLLKVTGLTKNFLGPDGEKRTAVNGVSFQMSKGSTLGIAGESGSGKTTLTRLILGLEKPDAGSIEIRGRRWDDLKGADLRRERKRVQVIFQDPLGSFDPRYTVDRVIGEALDVAGYATRSAKHARSLELLDLVRLDKSFLSRRPIELSGGQRQRLAIARALAPEPDLLICDEPVSALDVSVQAQILELLASLKDRLGLSCLFISHDLGIIRRISDHVLVMKDGAVVEAGSAQQVFEQPQHPYTVTLLNAVVRLNQKRNPIAAISAT